jgi:hypothetical protein
MIRVSLVVKLWAPLLARQFCAGPGTVGGGPGTVGGAV